MADLKIDSDVMGIDTLSKRQEYAKIVPLLFYPYRIQDDLMLNESYWDRYKWALRNNRISPKDLQVIQNIQDVCHNCAKLNKAQDGLLKTTTCEAHKLDNKNKVKDNEATIPFDQIADMLQQRDDYRVGKVHPTKRSLSIIVSRCNIIQQNIPECISAITNILDIPEGITLSCGLSKCTKETNIKDVVTDEQNQQPKKK